MRMPLVASLVALTVLAGPTRASAQDIDDFVAYLALDFTPLGAFVPLPPATAGARGSAFVLRYGNLDLGETSLNNFGIGGDFAAGRGRLGLTLGVSTCDDCDQENLMAGVDYTAPLTQNKVSVSLRPAFGFSRPTDGDGTALSLGLSLPIGVDLSGASGPVIVPFLSPGFGYGRLSDDGDSESGTRPMLGGGISVSARQSTLAAHLGFQKVFVEDGEMTFGLGVSFGRRASPSTP